MAKAKPAPKPRTRRPRQGYLPDMEPPSIPALDEAADDYYETVEERHRLTIRQSELEGVLIDTMRQHSLDRYETRDGLVVSVLNKSNVKCKKKPDKDPSSNGDANED